MRDKSCLSKAVCLAHLYKVYQSDSFDNHVQRNIIETRLLVVIPFYISCMGLCPQRTDCQLLWQY